MQHTTHTPKTTDEIVSPTTQIVVRTMDEYMENFNHFLFRGALIDAIAGQEGADVRDTLLRVKKAYEDDKKSYFKRGFLMEPEEYTLMDDPEHPSDPLCGYYFVIEWLMGVLEHDPELNISSLADGMNSGIPSNIFFKSSGAEFIEFDVLDELFNGFYWNAATTLVMMMVERRIIPSAVSHFGYDNLKWKK